VMLLQLSYQVHDLFFPDWVNVIDFHGYYFQYQVFEKRLLSVVY
jgi:hypothetical protein